METTIQVVNSEWATLAQEAPKVAEALTAIEKLTLTLPAYDERQKAIAVVTTTAEYANLGEVLTQIRAAAKQGEAYLSPFEVMVSRVQTFLRTARQKHVNQCTMIAGVIISKLKVWERKVEEEKKAVAVEQAKLDKKAEKTGEPAGTVQPNITRTSVSGYRPSVKYWVEIEDLEKFLKAYRSDPRKYGEYIAINQQKLNADYRESKGTMKLGPGLKGCKG